MPKKGNKKKRYVTSTKDVTRKGMDVASQQVEAAWAKSFMRGACLGSLGKNLNPFPPTMRRVFNIAVTGNIATASAATNSYAVGGNAPILPLDGTNLFGNDLPNPAGSTVVNTEQCAAADVLFTAVSSVYGTCTCMGSAIRVQMLPSAAADTLTLIVGPGGPAYDNYANAGDAQKGRFAKEALIGSGNSDNEVTNACSTAEVHGVSEDIVRADPDFACAYNANAGLPALGWAWYIWYATASVAVLTGTVAYRVEIAYDCVLQNPKWGNTVIDLADQKAASERRREKKRREELLAEEDETSSLCGRGSSASSSVLSSTSSSSATRTSAVAKQRNTKGQ